MRGYFCSKRPAFLIAVTILLIALVSSSAMADYAVQVGSFKQEDHAKEMASALLDAGYSVFIEAGPEGHHRVRVGPYKTRPEAEKAGKQLKEKMKLSYYIAGVSSSVPKILTPDKSVLKPQDETLPVSLAEKPKGAPKAVSISEDTSFIKIDLRNIYKDPSAELLAIQDAEELIQEAKTHMGRPYVWAGSTPGAGGFDCSGFVYYLLTKRGYKMGRRASEQFLQGLPVERAELRPGDLVFFRTYFNGASHVGIYMGGNEFIHSSSSGGGVVINQIKGYYDQRFYGARRILGLTPARLDSIPVLVTEAPSSNTTEETSPATPAQKPPVP